MKLIFKTILSLFTVFFVFGSMLSLVSAAGTACTTTVGAIPQCPGGFTLTHVPGQASSVNICIETNYFNNSIGEFVKQDGTDFKICVKGTETDDGSPYANSTFSDTYQSSFWKNDPTVEAQKVCCPSTFVPHSLGWRGTTATVCCPTGKTIADYNNLTPASDNGSNINLNSSTNTYTKTSRINGIGSNVRNCVSPAGTEVVESLGDYDLQTMPASVIQDVVPSWTCGSGPGGIRCRIDTAGNFAANQPTFPSEAACGTNQPCHDDGETVTVGPDTKKCNNGAWVLPAAYRAVIQGCESITDSFTSHIPDPLPIPQSALDEYNACAACINGTAISTSTGVTPTARAGFVYTSFTGCLDVSRDGIITRIFQIGIGLIGGAMVVRIIQAAFMMQTDNPEKIREAREIIGSAIIALLVLVGAITILRFLGINVLNVLPANFLQGTVTPTP
jgi:hypothetical protein